MGDVSNSLVNPVKIATAVAGIFGLARERFQQFDPPSYIDLVHLTRELQKPILSASPSVSAAQVVEMRLERIREETILDEQARRTRFIAGSRA